MSATGEMYLREIEGVYVSPPPHWVGDGFPVRPAFGRFAFTPRVSPFLMLDYAGPVQVEPTTGRPGVGEHPHAGFETVTFVFQGELEHRDSTGSTGRIGAGEVQWMTAGAGVVHEEKYSREFARSGGVLEMVQLWVNLPSRNKAAPPGYQTLSREAIPEVELPEGAGTLRVIAGRFGGVKGPARTFTPIDAWELRLLAGRRAALPTAGGHTTAALVLKGSVTLNESRRAGPADLVLFRREGGHILFEASEPCTILLLSGEPIDEPIAAHGPFVMNSESEIVQAIDDYRSGRMGRLG